MGSILKLSLYSVPSQLRIDLSFGVLVILLDDGWLSSFIFLSSGAQVLVH